MMVIDDKDIKTLLIYLDLPHAWSFGTNAMKTLEDEVGEAIHDAANEDIEKGLEEDIELMLHQHDKWTNMKWKS